RSVSVRIFDRPFLAQTYGGCEQSIEFHTDMASHQYCHVSSQRPLAGRIEMPRLMIIQAASYRGYGDRRPLKIRKRRLIGAVMPYLAALAPREWDVTLVDDAVEEVDFDAPVDVVAITARMVTS